MSKKHPNLTVAKLEAWESEYDDLRMADLRFLRNEPSLQANVKPEYEDVQLKMYLTELKKVSLRTHAEAIAIDQLRDILVSLQADPDRAAEWLDAAELATIWVPSKWV